MLDSPLHPPRPFDFELLDRYLANKATAAEQQAVECWMAENPAHATLVAIARTGRRGGTLADVDVERAIERFWWTHANDDARKNTSHRLRKNIPAGLFQARSVWRRKLGDGWTTRTRMAFAAIGAALVCVMMVEGTIGSYLWNAHPSTRPPLMSIYTTGNGERANITLPDGSRVNLNVASRLEVPVDYRAGDRTVRVHGEALFTVVPRPGSPFNVTIGETNIRVLGTSFVVRQYATDRDVLVAVQEGKVMTEGTVLTARDIAHVIRSRVQVARDQDIEGILSFANGILTLTDVPLAAAVHDLGRWCDAEIRIADPSLARMPVTGTFAPGSPTDLARYLSFVFGARVERAGRVLTISSR